MSTTELERALHAAFSGARALVTGGNGFIASHVVDSLLRLGAKVTTVDLRPSDEAPRPGLQRRRGDVAGEAFGRLLREEGPFDYLFHLAARAYAAGSVQEPLLDYQTNLAATVTLLEQFRQLQLPTRLIFASSAAVYGNPAGLPIHEGQVTVPVSPYGVSKLAAERYIDVYARLYGVRATSLRLFSVYGPRQPKQVVYDLLAKLHASPGELEVIGDGSQMRDLVYVEDVARAFLVAAARAPHDGGVYNVASGVGVTIGELAHLVVAAQGSSARVCFTGQNRPGDPDRWLGSHERLAALGWAPRFRLEEGLRATAAWFNGSVVERALEVQA
jgi:UDP-glucose 4-epimerase